MNRSKKLLSMLLALVLVCSLLPGLSVSALAEPVTYTLVGATAHSTGVTFDGQYYTARLQDSLTPVFSGGNNPPSGYVEIGSFRLWTDSGYSQGLTVEPEEGETYYSYVVIYNSDSCPSDVTIDYGHVDPSQVDFTIDGYTLSLGKISKQLINSRPGVEIRFTVMKKDTPAPATYTVSFDSNGGSGTMNSMTVNEGEQCTLPECSFTAPVGHVFDKWDAGDPGDKIDVTSDMTVKAVWKPITYTVKFDADGGTGTMADATVTFGDQYTLPECDFTAPKGKEFDTWDAGKPGDKIDVTADMTIKAVWKPITYTVKFDADGGTGTMPDIIVNYGEAYTLPVCDFTAPEGKEFDKWDAGKPGDKIDVTADMTIKAVWKPITYTVTFETNGGSAVTTQLVEYGKNATEPAAPKKSGFEFAGWFSDAGLTQSFDFATQIKSNTTIYAKWAEIKYKIVSGGGSIWTKGSSSNVDIRVKREPNDATCFSHFTDVKLDGKLLKKDTDYTVKEGSTIVSFKAATLEKLSVGFHPVSIIFDDGKVDNGINIYAPGTNPKTGDESMGLWIGLLAFSGLALAGGLAFALKKRRDAREH